MATRARYERTAELASAPSSVTLARHLVRDDLAGRNVPARLIEDALVVVSELLGNAVQHARPLAAGDSRGRVRLLWSVDGRHGVRIEVTDGGGANEPHIAPPNLGDTGGRGLAIVAAIASDWGVVNSDHEVTVYAVVAD
jgi:serine/threonine-protein kinase RsbW